VPKELNETMAMTMATEGEGARGGLPALALLESDAAELRILEDSIRAKCVNGSRLEILEAGCGVQWVLNLEGVDYRLTGLDVNPDALRTRRDQRKDLDEAILGDLRDADLAESSYDVVYSAFVLEHVDGSERVLDNCLRWLKPGGLLILKIPDARSVRGFITRITPHWFHVFYYKHIERWPDAGKPGHGPFPVWYDDLITRRGVLDYIRRRRLILRAEYGLRAVTSRRGWLGWLRDTGARVVHWLSLRSLALEHANLTYLVEKPAAGTPNGEDR
jgi:SAM-dependent methyltransferase